MFAHVLSSLGIKEKKYMYMEKICTSIHIHVAMQRHAFRHNFDNWGAA